MNLPACGGRNQRSQKGALLHSIYCGGDRLDYPGRADTPTGGLTAAKSLFNIVVSTPGAKFMSLDIKKYYLGTPINRYEYMRIPVADIPADVMK